jgi:SAM-dependent methyltransferase
MNRATGLKFAAVGDGLHRQGRRFEEGYPGLAKRALEVYVTGAQKRTSEEPHVRRVLSDLDALVDIRSLRDFLVVGCGPWPATVEILRRLGYDATGVEPVPDFVASARGYLDDADVVIEGAAEQLPVGDASYDVVFLESVLEHVDSPRLTLSEAYRVLRGGGIVLVTTTNRHSVKQAEFNVPLFNWLPGSLKESYVFFHLHYRPALANYTERPAVHWFSYADLCELGREVGFARFYSHLDLLREEAVRGRLRAAILRRIQKSPLLRTLALTQRGGHIYMVKRPVMQNSISAS